MGVAFQGKYSNSIPNAALAYPSTCYFDDLAWGAAWLYQRTGELQFLSVSLLNLYLVPVMVEGA